MNVVCSCSEVIAKSESGVTKIRSKLVVMRGNSVAAVCKGCGAEVPLPLQKSILESTSAAGPPLILRK